MRRIAFILACLLVGTLPAVPANAQGPTALEVGPGKKYSRIEDAVSAAAPGDTIIVYPLSRGKPYERVSLVINKSLTIRSNSKALGAIKISGQGVDYSGRGNAPKAIFQINPDADETTIEGFDISDARNTNHNAAGIKVNQATRATIRNCEIHECDMGIMSNGGKQSDCGGLTIEFCRIYRNGYSGTGGYSHNLYLHGSGAVIRGCEIFESLSGNNITSRIGYLTVEACYIHDAANLELDIVDSEYTTKDASHAQINGCIIVKNPHCRGKKGVIEFGQDLGGEHDGVLYLINDTIATPFVDPVVLLTAFKSSAWLSNCIFWDCGQTQEHMSLRKADGAASTSKILLFRNWLSLGFGPDSAIPGTRQDYKWTGMYVANLHEDPPFSAPGKGDYSLAQPAPEIVDRGLITTYGMDIIPAYEYVHPANIRERINVGSIDFGAYEYHPK